MDISIIVPTLNEAAAAPALVARLNELFSASNISHEILVVDGGSTDGTQDLVRAAGAKVLACPKLGYGPAFRQGVSAAQGQFIMTIDGDGSHPPQYALDLWNARDKADLIIGSRFIPGGSAQMAFARLPLSRALNALTRFFFNFPVRDASGGLRLYHADLVKSFSTQATDFSIQQEALAQALKSGAQIMEIPFHFMPRIGGKSKAPVLSLCVSYLKLFFRIKRGLLNGHP